MSLVVLSDFDGTIADIDTGEFVLKKFAQGEWELFDKRLEHGEISLEECLICQFSQVKTTRSEILSAIDLERISLRRNFERLKIFCEENKIPFRIVSAGLDFCIRHVLKSHGIDSAILISPKARCTRSGIRFSFPRLHDKRSISFKDDSVRYYKTKNRKVIFIGDGASDYNAAKISDLSFVVKGSNLSRMCKSRGVRIQEFSDFQEVVDEIRRLNQPSYARSS